MCRNPTVHAQRAGPRDPASYFLTTMLIVQIFVTQLLSTDFLKILTVFPFLFTSKRTTNLFNQELVPILSHPSTVVCTLISFQSKEGLWDFLKHWSKLPPSNSYSHCLLCLGEAHQVDLSSLQNNSLTRPTKTVWLI